MAAMKKRWAPRSPETFDWQPTSSSVSSDLREWDDGGALYVHAAHLRPLRCDMMVSWAASRSLLRGVVSTFLLCSTAGQTELTTELFMITAQQCSPAHTVHRYYCWTRDSVLLYNTLICGVQGNWEGCSDQRSPANKCKEWCNTLKSL